MAIQASNLITSLSWPHGQSWFFVKFGIAGLAFGAALTAVMPLPLHWSIARAQCRSRHRLAVALCPDRGRGGCAVV
jgi:hypothetical protein